MATYSISLDNVDVAPLPMPTQQHNDFLKKEYFAFQVMKKDTVEEPIFYTCHICDIQVPVSFIREHTASMKHRANANIASVAASRLRAHVLSPLPVPSTHEPVAFCDNCSIIVDLNHEKTEQHTVAVRRDNMLWDLMNAYINASKGLAKEDVSSKDVPCATDGDNNDKKEDGNLDGEAVTYNSATYIFHESTSKQYMDSAPKVVVGNKEQIPSESSRGFSSFTKAKEIIENGTAVTRDYYAKQLRERHAGNSYVELLYQVNNIDTKSGLKESGGEIVIDKGNETIHVPADNFHSIIYNKDGNALCVLCNARFHPDYVENHKYEMIHMNQLVNVYNNNYIRKVQIGTRHCIICNLKLKRKDVDAHVKSHQHIQNKNLYTKTKTDMPNEEESHRGDQTKKGSTSIDTTVNQSVVGTSTHHVENDTVEPRTIVDKQSIHGIHSKKNEITNERVTYSISLDDVDVAPLPMPTQQHNDFLKKEYFEFQVMKKDIVEEPIFYTCHICDIQVPVSFIREHTASMKHRANANIASVAASRLRAHVLSPLPVPSTNAPVAFCDNCSIIVDLNHDKTEQHTVAVRRDNMLWDLMNAYINASKGLAKEDASSKDVPCATNGDGNDKKEDRNLDGEAVTYNSESTSKQYMDSAPKVVVGNKEQIPPESSRGFKSFTKAKEIIENDTAVTRDYYAKQLRERHAGNSYVELLYQVNNIDTKSGLKESGGEILIDKGNETIHVPADNFHSIIYNKDGNVLCVLCKARFHPDYVENHKYEMIHMNQLVNVYDNNYIRKVQFGTRHCIICNLKLKRKDVDAHVKSHQHIQNKNLYTKTKTDMPNEEESHRVDQTKKGSTSIDTTVNQSIVGTSTHHVENDTVEPRTIVDKQSIHGIHSKKYEITNERVTYSISLDDVDVAPLPMPTQQHNDFLKKEYFEFQVMKKETFEEPIFYTCHICDIQVPVSFIREHAASMKHRANANIASVAASRLRAHVLSPLPVPSTHEPVAFCDNCSIIVDLNHEKTEQHTVAVRRDNMLWDLINAYINA